MDRGFENTIIANHVSKIECRSGRSDDLERKKSLPSQWTTMGHYFRNMYSRKWHETNTFLIQFVPQITHLFSLLC